MSSVSGLISFVGEVSRLSNSAFKKFQFWAAVRGCGFLSLAGKRTACSKSLSARMLANGWPGRSGAAEAPEGDTQHRGRSFSKNLLAKSFVTVCAVLLIVFFTTKTVTAESIPVVGTPTVGWKGDYLVGRWTQVVVPVTLQESSSLQLELTAVDSDGNRVEFLSPSVALEPGDHELTGCIKVGRLNGEIGVRINQRPGPHGIPGRTDWLKAPLIPATRLIVTVGDPRGFEFETSVLKQGSPAKLARSLLADLPTNSAAFDGVSALVLAGSLELSTQQANALRDWVFLGGRLVISLSQDSALASRSIQTLADWLPVRVGEQPVTVREFGGLEFFAGKNIRIPQSAPLSIPNLQFDVGETLAASRSDALLVRSPYGLGSVEVLALDLTAAPLKEWKALTPFCARLVGLRSTLDDAEKGASQGSQLSSTGITDLATQLNATQDHFEQVNRASPWFVMGLLIALLIVIGPLDYFFVHHVLKRPRFTWISFPAIVASATLLASWFANASNGSTHHANQLDIINVDVSTAKAAGRHFITLYSPVTSQTTVTVEPVPLVKTSAGAKSCRLSWQGVPETTFGGMLREMSFEQGAKYQEQSDGQLTQLPLMQWSSKALVADSQQSVEKLVECDLRASATGRLTGTISHRFPVPIEDWMLVYKNVVYRQLQHKDDLQPLPLQPKTILRADQPNVYTREIRPFLTGITTMATPRFGESHVIDFTSRQTNYDPLSLDPANLIRILTFYDEIGGGRYTGLTNQMLADQDLSHLLKLGRAILFGRIDHPAATIQQDGTSLTADRRTSFVRLILPVTKSSELIRGLQRVVPD